MLRLLIVNRFASQLAERSEFDQKRAHLGRIGFRVANLARFQIHFDVRHSGGRVKHRKKAIAQILHQSQQPLVATELIAAEQTSQHADGDFEILHVNIFVEGEVGSDQFARFVGLRVEPMMIIVSRASTGVISNGSWYQS